jgi:hypothetical protein
MVPAGGTVHLLTAQRDRPWLYIHGLPYGIGTDRGVFHRSERITRGSLSQNQLPRLQGVNEG